MEATTLKQTEQDLLALIRTRCIPNEEESVALDAESLLFEDRWINSINILALIDFVEARLGRRLDDSEILMPNFRSVRAIVNTFFND